MGLLSKLKKKVTKGLRKITPKEIAPLLPLAAMVVPGMGGIMSSSLAKFLVPQLLTAAGSARTSGKINPLNQIMAGLGSMSAINAGNTAATGDIIKAAGGPRNVPGLEYGSANLPGANPGLLDKAASAMSGVPGLGKAMDVTARGQQGLLSLNPFDNTPATFSKSMLAPLSAAGGMYMMDAAEAANQKLQEEQAEAAANAAAANDASNNLIAAMARFSDPINRYGNNPFGDFNPVTGQLLNTGGRVGYANGTDARGVNYLSDNSPTAEELNAMDFLLEPRKAMGEKEEMINVMPTRRPEQERMGIMGMVKEALGNLIMGDAMNTENPDDYSITRRALNKILTGENIEPLGMTGMAAGGRIGMNMGGGLGSIPQTTTIPQGMQLEGRGGGFIPMGAQERKDDVPAMLAKNEFVMTADAVRAAGGGSVEKGAQKMYDVMNQLEAQV